VSRNLFDSPPLLLHLGSYRTSLSPPQSPLSYPELQSHCVAVSLTLRQIHPRFSADEPEDLARRWQSEAALNIILNRTSMGHTPFNCPGVMDHASLPARRTVPSEEQVLASQRQRIIQYVKAYLKITVSEPHLTKFCTNRAALRASRRRSPRAILGPRDQAQES
jgi:hypothetical protein